ncbi:MAG: hypothetical protein AM326_07765 [Candidatus Thorarchaeota archaeon SMTZ-45]|nr:MAG: hypothetical protein AM326_07765 [Candidatus Thorarchaeota archaeon SMTZ-45]
MKSEDRTNYVYRFTYNSGPGLREVFQCKYVKPDEALTRFQRILSLTDEPFDFKIVVIDESKREESSFEVEGGSVKEMIEKFRVFLEASTGILFVEEKEDVEVEFEEINFESMSSFEKMHIVIYASFKHGKFSSLDVAEIFEATFNEDLPKSTASTYLARMWNDNKGHLERYGNRSGYTYRLKTEIAEVQKETERAEDILASIQMHVGK